MSGKWDADPAAGFRRRLGKSAHELGTTAGDASCPELWELDNGDIAVIGTELTSAYRGRLPAGVSIDRRRKPRRHPAQHDRVGEGRYSGCLGRSDDAVGERLELPEYYADFQRNFRHAREFWKLERGQVFAEPGDASWEAFDAGDWDEAMRLARSTPRRP